jgi:flagellar motor switch protein FliN/FliY
MVEDDAGFDGAALDLNLAGASLDELLGETVAEPARPLARDLQVFRNIPVRLTLEVDSVEVPLADLLALSQGTVLALDKPAGAPLDMRVNGVLLARAEVVVVNGKYGLRLLEVVDETALAGLAG